MKKLLFICILFLTSSTYAQDVWFSSTIKTVYPLNEGSFILTFREDSPNCMGKDDYHVVREGLHGVTAEGVKMIYSAALTAAASGTRVAIYFNSATSNCEVNRMKVLF